MQKIASLLFITAFIFTGLHASADPETQTNLDRVPVSKGKYITGGILGSAIGFGIGHGIQGRYAEKGWIFTASEAAGLTVMIVGASQCASDNNKDTNNDLTCTSSQKTMMSLGLVTMIGFHIWEIVDVWTGARPVEEKTTAFLIPNPEAPGIGISYTF